MSKLKRQRGSTLIEILIALAVMGATSGAVFLDSVSTVLLGTGQVEEGTSISESIANSQVEYIWNLPYNEDDSYPVISTPPGYAVEIEVTDISPADNPESLQEIEITVLQDGKAVYSLDSYKVRYQKPETFKVVSLGFSNQ